MFEEINRWSEAFEESDNHSQLSTTDDSEESDKETRKRPGTESSGEICKKSSAFMSSGGRNDSSSPKSSQSPKSWNVTAYGHGRRRSFERPVTPLGGLKRRSFCINSASGFG